MKNDKKQKCQVLIAKQWYTCQTAVREPSGWLSYTLRDGTVGLSQPKNWRIVKQ